MLGNNDTYSEAAMSMFCEAYLEGFGKSKQRNYTKRKREASAYARKLFPELGKTLEATSLRARGKEADKDLILYGDILKGKLARLGLRKKFLNNGVTEYSKGDYALYQSWVVTHDFVPKDELLAYFTGGSKGSFSGARYRLHELGYKFESIENGWKVVIRPEPKKEEKPKEAFSNEEIQLMKTLLKKFERM